MYVYDYILLMTIIYLCKQYNQRQKCYDVSTVCRLCSKLQMCILFFISATCIHRVVFLYPRQLDKTRNVGQRDKLINETQWIIKFYYSNLIRHSLIVGLLESY